MPGYIEIAVMGIKKARTEILYRSELNDPEKDAAGVRITEDRLPILRRRRAWALSTSEFQPHSTRGACRALLLRCAGKKLTNPWKKHGQTSRCRRDKRPCLAREEAFGRGPEFQF